MSSFKDVIASLADPTPKIHDPEDDVNIETVARLDKLKNDEDLDKNSSLYSISELRSKTAPLLEDVDPTYSGRKVSRKSLDNIFQNDSFAGEKSDESSSNDTEVSEADESDECRIEKMKKIFQDHENDNASADEGEHQDNETDESEDVENDDMVNKFSNIDVASEIEKGQAVKAQQELFNRLCECRIKLQKLLLLANKLPQHDCWKAIKKEVGAEVNESLKKGSIKVKTLLNNSLNLQEAILSQNIETRVLDCKEKQNSPSDEEIPSDTEDEMDAQPDDTMEEAKKCFKRKMKCEEYGDILAKKHKSLAPYRMSVIQKWDEKTKLSSGRITQKSFSAFESSAVKQIEQILQDENRLIKRTQLKRSIYRVVGKPEVQETTPEEQVDDKPASKQDLLLKDYDPEIFDDDDFYRQLLKEVIDSRSVGIDPTVLRKQMEIQHIRNKIKKKVDTKASKGRKIRYDVHPKLVNYMAPVLTSTISDTARDNLIKCLFGRSLVKL